MEHPFSGAMDRRDFLKTSVAMAAVSSLRGRPLFAGQTGDRIPIALQLYSVRKQCAEDFSGTVAAVAEIGYQGVEFAGFHDYPAAEVRRMLDDNGLKCAGSHTALDLVLGDALEKTIAFNKTIENPYLIVPWLPEERRNSKAAWLKTADLFNELAEKVRPHGMHIGYHNHGMEFQPMDGETPWDLFARYTSEDVILQFDTGNAAAAGADPLPYLKKYPGRSVTIHLKEHSDANQDALIGQGDLPFEKIIDVCRTAGGTKWFIVEEEKQGLPPLKAVKISHDNLMKLL